MADRTPIEWSDATASATTRVVAGDKLSGTARSVELLEGAAAATGTFEKLIGFAGQPVVYADAPFDQSMMSNTLYDLKVFRSVIGLITVDVMDLLSLDQPPSDLLFGENPVLVGVAAHVSQVVAGKSDQDIPIGGDGSPAAPVRIPLARMNYSHGFLTSTGATQ